MKRAFEFWVFVYESADPSKRLHPACITEFAFTEHGARRFILNQYHAAGMCVHYIERVQA